MPKPTDIELSLNISPKDVKKSAQELKEAIEEAFNQTAGTELNSKLKGIQASMSKTASKANELTKQIEALENTKIPTDEYTKAQEAFDKALKASTDYQAQTSGKVEELRAQLKELENAKIPTKDYDNARERAEFFRQKLVQLEAQSIKLQDAPQTSKTVKKLEELEKAADKVTKNLEFAEKQMRQLEESGKAFTTGVVDTKSYEKLSNELAQINDKGQKFEDDLRNATLEVNKIVQAGRDFTLGSETADYTKLTNQLADVNNQARVLKTRWDEEVGAENRANTSNSKLSNALRALGAAMSSVSKNATKSHSSVNKFSKSTKNYASAAKTATKHSNNFGTSLKKMTVSFIKAMIGVRGLYMLFRKLREAVVDGVKNLVLFEGESGRLNKSLSAIQSAFATFKNSIGAAIAPLINSLAPILTKIINLLTVATQKVSMFIAAFTGAKTYLVADKVQKNYAASLADTAANAKKAEKALKGYLSPLDEINQYQTNQNDEDTLGGGADTGTFSEIPIDPKFLAWLEDVKAKLKDIIDQLLGPFKAAWANMGDEVVASWKRALESVKQAIADIGASFLEVWTNGTGQRFLENILQLVIDVGNWVNSIATAFDEAWTEAGRGTALFQSFFDAINNILELIHTIGESMRTVWDEGFGKAFIADILEIMTNINNFFSNLADRFKEAWEKNDVGTRIIRDISNIVLDFTNMLNDMTGALSEWAEGLNFDNLLESFENLLNSIEPVVDIITDGLAWAWENVLLPIGSWYIEEFLPTWWNTLAAALDTFAAAVEAAKPHLEALYNDFLVPLGEFIWDGIKDGLQALQDLLNGITDVLNGNQSFEDFIKNLSPLEVGILAVATAIGVVSAALTVFSAVGTAAGAVLAFLTSPITLVVLAITALIAIGVLLYKNWDTIREKAIELWGKITKAVSEKVEHITSTVKTNLNNLKQHLNTFKTNVVSIFTSIWNGIKNQLNKIIGGVEHTANKIISGVNSLIGKLNQFSFDIPSWVPSIGGNSFGFNIKTLGTISIPRLAEGAVIPPNNEFLAMLGDQKNGTNIETPLDTMVQAFKQAIGEMDINGGVSTINFLLPNKKLVAQYAIEGGRVLQVSTGRNPFDLL